MGTGVGGCQRQPTSFVPHAWALQPCAPPGLQLPGAQVAVSRVGSGRGRKAGMGGAEEMGAALGLSVGIGEPEMAALPGSEQLL